jgi:hypothetical protein
MNTVFEAPALAVAAPRRSVEELVAELLSLSPDKKLEIITRLAQSLQSAGASTPSAASVLGFVGAWADDPEADKMEQAIVSIRHAANGPS